MRIASDPRPTFLVPTTFSLKTLSTQTETPPEDSGSGGPWKVLTQELPVPVQSALMAHTCCISRAQCGPTSVRSVRHAPPSKKHWPSLVQGLWGALIQLAPTVHVSMPQVLSLSQS